MRFSDIINRLLGKKRNSASTNFPPDPSAPQPPAADDTIAGLKHTASQVGQQLEQAGEVIREKASEVWQDIQPVMKDMGEHAQKTWDHARETIEQAMDKLSADDPANGPQDNEPEITPDADESGGEKS